MSAIARHLAVLGLLVVVACHHKPPTTAIARAPDVVLQAARQRTIPNPVKSKFGIKLSSKPLDLAASTTGGLVLSRPGKGRVELDGPLGNPLFTVTSDGVGMSVIEMQQTKQLVATDAESVLRQTTGGVAGLDDVLAMLEGDLPFDDAPVQSMSVVGDGSHPEDGIRVVLGGPNGSTVEATLDPDTATPELLVAKSAKGDTLLTAKYDAFAAVGEQLYMPTRVEVYVPAIDLSVETKYRTWETYDGSEDVFGLTAPASFQTSSLEEAVRKMVDKMKPGSPG